MPGTSATARTSPTATSPRRCTRPSPPRRPPGYRRHRSRAWSAATSGGGSLEGCGGGEDDDLLVRLRALVGEARDHHADGDSPAAMARLRVAQDLVDLRIVALAEG